LILNQDEQYSIDTVAVQGRVLVRLSSEDGLHILVVFLLKLAIVVIVIAASVHSFLPGVGERWAAGCGVQGDGGTKVNGFGGLVDEGHAETGGG
jgi:hypothetical protein